MGAQRILLVALFWLTASINGIAAPSDAWQMPPLAWFVKRLPAPPDSNSSQDLADVSHSIARQSAAAPNDFKRAERSNDFSIFTFDKSLGRKFEIRNFPLTAKLSKEAESRVDGVTSQLKRFYRRERLEVVHPGKVKLFVTRAPGYSYPSGHTARAKVFGLLLAEVDPAKHEALLEQARQIGDDRVLSGQHYRSDVEAGRIVGRLVFQRLMANSSFRKSLQLVKQKEWSSPASSSR